MPTPGSSLQLGFFSVPNMAMGIAGSIAVHATLFVALQQVWIRDPLVTQSSDDPALAKGLSVQVRLESPAREYEDFTQPAPVRHEPIAEPRDEIVTEIRKLSRFNTDLSALVRTAESSSSMRIEFAPAVQVHPDPVPTPIIAKRELKSAPAPHPNEHAELTIPECTPMSVLDPALPRFPEQPSGVENGAEALQLPEPIYPQRSIRLEQEGTVLVAVEVLAGGRIGEIKLHTSSGHRLLDRAALKAARHGRFKPAFRDGRSVRSVVVVPFEFHLIK